MSDRLLSINETSEKTTLPVGTLRYLRHRGEGPKSFKMGGRLVRYRESDVDAWIEAQAAKAVGDDLAPAAG